MSKNTKSFQGGKKDGYSLLWPLEEKLKKRLAAAIPPQINSIHLTLATIPWSAGVLIFSYFARFDTKWLWMVSLVIALQYLTDLIDGEVGRLRKEGLVKWGFYMDHYLDYVFLTSVLTGYSFFIGNDEKILLFFILTVFGAFMVNSFLSFAANSKFRIAYFLLGPTELRLTFILVNSALAMFGTTYLGSAMPFVLIGGFILLNIIVYNTQKELYDEDLRLKKVSQSKPS